MKHLSLSIIVLLLFSNVMHPMGILNIGTKWAEKSAGWVAEKVPSWVPWFCAVFFCGAQWQRFYNKWKKSEKLSAKHVDYDEIAGAKKRLESENEELKQENEKITIENALLASNDGTTKICQALGAYKSNQVIYLNPTVATAYDGICLYPNRIVGGEQGYDVMIDLSYLPKNSTISCRINGQAGKFDLIRNNIIAISSMLLKLIGAHQDVKIFDDDMHVVIDNTVKIMGASQILSK